MEYFNLIFPSKIIFGVGSIRVLGEEASRFGEKALLVTGVESLRRLKILEEVEENLKKAKIKIFHFEGVKKEPDIEILEKAREFSKRTNLDMVIGIGGGSVLDVAKATAALYNEEGSCREYQEGRRIENLGIPFIAVPTTSGSGSEATYNSVILDREKKAKRSIRDFSLMAKLVIVDPKLTLKVPFQIKATTSMDALVHAIEGYMSRNSNHFTDNLALSAINLIQANIREVVYKEDNISAHEHMSLAALKAGMVLANAGLGAIHGIAASLGAYLNVSHGLSCAVLLPKVLKFNEEVSGLKFYHLLQALGGHAEGLSIMEACENCILLLEKMMLDLKIPFHLERFDISNEDIEYIANNCSSSIRFNPRELKREDIIDLIKKALCI
jgi:alcohol dehydrogenase class IV